MANESKNILIAAVAVSLIAGAASGGAAGYLAGQQGRTAGSVFGKVVTVKEESAVIAAVDKVSPAVVSIIVTKDLPKIEQYNGASPFGSDFFREFFGDSFGLDFGPQYRQNGTEKREVGGGTGFVVTADGLIVTNKHVVSDPEAEYTVLMNDEKKYPAKVLARDTLNDLAVLRIEAKGLPTVELGDSGSLKVGQGVIAIGNALGEFRNTVSTGVVSGLARSIVASGGAGGAEQLLGVIQTDAAINSGNSGGPLLNIAGQVVGINTAVAQGAQGIGFAIPINEVRNAIDSVRQFGKIVRPWLGIRYQLVTKDYAKEGKLPVDYGALIIRGEKLSDLAVVPGSPADKAGLRENDIILELNGQRIDEKAPLARQIVNFKVGDTVRLKILRQGKEEEVSVKLEEMKQ